MAAVKAKKNQKKFNCDSFLGIGFGPWPRVLLHKTRFGIPPSPFKKDVPAIELKPPSKPNSSQSQNPPRAADPGYHHIRGPLPPMDADALPAELWIIILEWATFVLDTLSPDIATIDTTYTSHHASNQPFYDSMVSSVPPTYVLHIY